MPAHPFCQLFEDHTQWQVFASGIPWSWIPDGDGFSVSNLPTRFGPLNFRICSNGTDAIHLEVADTIRIPSGGLVISPPLPEGKLIVSAECGEECSTIIHASGSQIQVISLPFAAVLTLKGRDSAV